MPRRLCRCISSPRLPDTLAQGAEWSGAPDSDNQISDLIYLGPVPPHRAVFPCLSHVRYLQPTQSFACASHSTSAHPFFSYSSSPFTKTQALESQTLDTATMKLLDVLFFFITAVSVQAVEPPTATIQAREPPSFNVFAVSTACAAEPRQQQKRDDSCTRMGHLRTRPNAHRALRAVSYQRCANECVCRPGPNGCGSFAFVPNGRGLGRGRCRLYEKHLDELPYEDGPAADGHIVRK